MVVVVVQASRTGEMLSRPAACTSTISFRADGWIRGLPSEAMTAQSMKTVRFSQVVSSAGKPSTHLQLVAVNEDRALQSAIKQHRVMSVNQSTVGTTADHGVIGHDLEA